jgi:hypothetical protein
MSMDREPSARGSSPDAGYRIAGEGREIFTRLQIRNKIRDGHISAATELAPQGSDDFRDASSYPELGRYFSLVSGQPVAAGPSATVRGVVGARPTASPVSSVPNRLALGLIYPFTGLGWAILLVLAILQAVPIVGLIAAGFLAVYQMAVIRTSAEGSTRMPPIREVGGPITFMLSLLKVFVVGLASSWPMIVVSLFVVGIKPLWYGSILLTVVYAPAAFALLARTNSLAQAVSPSAVFGLIGTLGIEYFIALAALFAALTLARFTGQGTAFVLVRMMRNFPLIPAVRGFLSEWGFFYFAHLVGYAMYRRI